MISDNKIKHSGIYKLVLIFFYLAWLPAHIFTLQANTAWHEIKGFVKDAQSGAGISAARINVAGDKVSAATDVDGSFVIKVSSPAATLKVSAYGYATREFSVRGKSEVLIFLFSEKLRNFYNPVPAFAKSDNRLTQPASHKSAMVTGQSSALTIDEALQEVFSADARVLTRSGNAGMGASVFLRGLNSINANAQPLYVVDGVPRNNLFDVTSIHDGFYSNPLLNIELSDIESVTVMKDGTSVYGSKASNGVILIRTRRAREMATRINLNINTGINTAPRQIPLLNAGQYRSYVSELLGTTGISPAETDQLPFLNDNPARSTYNMYHNDTHWASEIYRNGITQNYNINVTGGDEKALYYFALGYANNNGVLKNTGFGRYNMRLNADIKMADRISVGVNIGFSRIDRQLIDDGVNAFTSPAWLSKIKAPFLSPNTFTSLGDQTTEYAYADIFMVGNPGAVIDYSINTLKQNYFNVSLKPEYRVSESLVISNQFDYQTDKTNEDYYRPYLFAAPVYVDGVGYSYNARSSQVMRYSSVFNDLRADYSKSFRYRHTLKAFGGLRYQYNSYESDFAEGHNSMSNSSVNLMGGFSNIRTDGINNIYKSLSCYFNAHYAYDNRYFAEATFSVDGSSRFGAQANGGFSLFGQRWAVFPSLSAAWLVSSEPFMKKAENVSLLKLRAGYGLTGNDDIADYQTNAYFSSVRLKNVSSGLVLSSLANPEIGWESTSRVHAGIDMGLFNDRFVLTIDLFSSVTQNLLVLKDYPEVSGLGKYWSNDGTLSNNGFETTVNIKVLNLKDFGWETALSVGHYRNRITELNNGSFVTKAFDAEIYSAVGNAAGVFYGYKTNGVFATEAEALAAGLKISDGKGGFISFGAGDMIFADFTPDGVIDEKDRQLIGDPNPDYYGSVHNNFYFGNFSLSALITYSCGNDVYNYQRQQLEAGRSFDNQTPVMLARWKSEGDQTLQPRAVYDDPMGNARFSDRWIEDGSYVRLKSVTVSYDVPLKNGFIQGLKIWASAGNLLTMSNYLGSDPEFSAGNKVLFQGIDAALMPSSHNYFIGIKMDL
ncbi:MAG: SusC/RagA family TonB-linked outer membrane protein [Paludibacteraceae bacterium]|nr:SusC/RagA family TonB-linked outer membrane protein [Paludibacteraceae bacterium]